MNTKTSLVFLSGALAVTLGSAWGTLSAAPIYENHFDVYRTITSVDSAKDRGARPRHPHLAKQRPAAAPVVLSDAPNSKLPGAR